MKMTKLEIVKQAIELFFQYRDGYGHDEDSAMANTIKEFAEAEDVEVLENEL